MELPAAPRLRSLGRWQRLIADYATSGVTVGDHAMAILRSALLTVPGLLATSAQLDRLPTGCAVAVAGLVIARQRPGTAKGTMFLLFEDEWGTINLIVPEGRIRAPPPPGASRAAAARQGPLGARGRGRQRDRGASWPRSSASCQTVAEQGTGIRRAGARATSARRGSSEAVRRRGRGRRCSAGVRRRRGGVEHAGGGAAGAELRDGTAPVAAVKPITNGYPCPHRTLGRHRSGGLPTVPRGKRVRLDDRRGALVRGARCLRAGGDEMAELGKQQGLHDYTAAARARTIIDFGLDDQARQILDQVGENTESVDYLFALAEVGDEARALAILQTKLGESPADTLLSDFYAPGARGTGAAP